MPERRGGGGGGEVGCGHVVVMDSHSLRVGERWDTAELKDWGGGWFAGWVWTWDCQIRGGVCGVRLLRFDHTKKRKIFVKGWRGGQTTCRGPCTVMSQKVLIQRH